MTDDLPKRKVRARIAGRAAFAVALLELVIVLVLRRSVLGAAAPVPLGFAIAAAVLAALALSLGHKSEWLSAVLWVLFSAVELVLGLATFLIYKHYDELVLKPDSDAYAVYFGYYGFFCGALFIVPFVIAAVFALAGHPRRHSGF